MIGAKQIIDWRRQGMRPVAIFIEAGRMPAPARFDFDLPERAIAHGLFPTVFVAPGELVLRHDLRFCAGCRVHVHADELTDEVIGFSEQAASAGASHVVVAAVSDCEILEWKGEWIGYADTTV